MDAGHWRRRNWEAESPHKPAFEVVSVKPMPPGRRDQYESYCTDSGKFIARGTPLLWSIKWAYGLNDYQMSNGWPEWLNSFGAFEVEARTDLQLVKPVQAEGSGAL